LGWEPKYNFSSLARDMYQCDFNSIVTQRGWK